MKTKNTLLIALLVLLTGMVSCQKDHDIPTGKVFNGVPGGGNSGGGEEPESGDTTYEYVDLGLPSGLLWATCNVGADSPEKFGDYFAWGETQPKETYRWDTYQHGGLTTLIKYCNDANFGYNGFTDNLTILLPEDDAATANWGNDWRMPTEEEWKELYENTTSQWTTLNGENGRLFTAENGNSLFLPAAGSYDDMGLYYTNSRGHYWSSSLSSSKPSQACMSDFYSSEGSLYTSKYRYVGLSVRPVRSSSQNYTIITSANPANGGMVSGNGTYQQGQTCTLTAIAEAGYTFVNWTENGSQVSTEASYTFTVTGNRTLVANFTLCDYTNIILNELNGETKFIEIYNKGTSDVPLNGMYIMKDDYVAGSIWTADVTIVAPAGGYVLLYSEDVVIDHPEHPENLIFHSGLSSKKSIRVTLFTPNGTVRDEFTRGTTGEWGQTISNVAPQSYARTPNGGDWKLANPTPGEANPSTGEDIPDVETPVNYTITVSANPSNGGTVTGGGTYQQGQTCTVTAIANEAYTFTNWTENGNQVSEDAIYTFVVTSNRTLIANYTFQGEGSGTFEDPYNVAAGIGWQSEEPVAWVHGYIVGAVKSGLSSVTSNSDINWSAPFDIVTNVVIADDVTCREISQCIIVNLPAGKPLRTQVNLMDNPTNLGKHLAVLGKLRHYFGQAGLRDSSGTEDDFVLNW